MLAISILALWAVPASATDVILSVPFMKQFWNDDTCGHGSCGPASLTMCCRYVFAQSRANGTPTPQDMINIWSYLGGDTDGNDPNGTSLDQLVSAAHWYFHLNTVYRTTSTLANVKNEIAAGNPVLVHVQAGYLSNRGYSYTGGHYIAAVGYNDNYLICNDPGTYLGEHKYYSNSDMINAMNAKGCGVLKGFYNPVVPPPTRPDPGSGDHIQYVPYIQDSGWLSWVADNATAGTIGKRLEGLAMYSPNTTVSYRAYVRNYGWQNWVSDGALAGTTGLHQHIEAVQITVGSGYSVSYQAYVQGSGWTSVVSNGATAGNPGSAIRIEALRAWFSDGTAPVISFVAINPTMAARGDSIRVIARASDDNGVTSVSANGIPLTYSGNSWDGYIAADPAYGLHTVTFVVGDAAGNTATDSTKSYRTAQIVGANIGSLKDAIFNTACDCYLFKVWGNVESRSTNYFDIIDGSGNKVRITATGYTGILIDDFISARGRLNASSNPITLICNLADIMKHNQ
jgi:hypothetical protein